VRVRLLRVLFEFRRDQAPRDRVGQVGGQRPQLGPGFGVKPVGGRVIRNRRRATSASRWAAPFGRPAPAVVCPRAAAVTGRATAVTGRATAVVRSTATVPARAGWTSIAARSSGAGGSALTGTVAVPGGPGPVASGPRPVPGGPASVTSGPGPVTSGPRPVPGGPALVTSGPGSISRWAAP
jgi:hypothetical protein